MMLLTVAELGAYLGMTSSGVRHVIRKHKIKARGANWKAKLYLPDDVLRHTGREDRRPSLAS